MSIALHGDKWCGSGVRTFDAPKNDVDSRLSSGTEVNRLGKVGISGEGTF